MASLVVGLEITSRVRAQMVTQVQMYHFNPQNEAEGQLKVVHVHVALEKSLWLV